MTVNTQCPDADTLRHAFDDACSAHDCGRLSEAKQGYQLLLRYLPDSAMVHYNIGLVYYDQGDYHQALEEFTQADCLAPTDSDTLFNLALCQKKTGDRRAAIATYARLLVLEPDHADGHYNLGGCYRDLDDDDQAIVCYQRALTLKPAFLPAVRNLAIIHHRAGHADEAIRYYTEVLEQQPENESIGYLLASLLGVPLDHAPEVYVREFFDAYATNFEYSLVEELGYDNPRQLYTCLSHSSAQGTRCAHGLDLGCGTGLSGAAFTGMVTALDGVDLSVKMLGKAATKGCYAHLHEDSILHHLVSTAETYDLFLATDVFIYVGDLLPIFTAAQSTARPDALFCFSTEHLDSGTYQLLPTGRFAYTLAYIQDIAKQTGWRVLAQEPTRLRKERDEWVAGDLWIFRLAATQV